MIQSKQRPATLANLKQMEVVTPEWVGSRWVGIQHGELVETIHGELDGRGIKVENENWYVTGQYNGRLSGSLELSIPGHTSFEGSKFSLGVQHSNLGDHSLKFAVGAKIFICSNGMVTGDYAVKRKHTKGVHLPDIISEGMTTYMEKVVDVKVIQTKMAETELSMTEVDRMLMEAGRAQLMPWSRIGQVDKEYRDPTFGDHSQETAWGLYNAFTYVVQKCPPTNQIKSINGFREIVLDAETVQV